MSIVFVNLSLVYNTVGTYQMLKLLNAPTMCIAEYYLLEKTRSWQEIVTLLGIIGGVAMVTVTDVVFSGWGLSCGVIAVFGTTAYQVYVKKEKQDHDVSGIQFLCSQSPFTVLILFPCTFLTDNYHDVIKHEFSVKDFGLIGITCVCAFVVCLSIIYLIGQTSAVTYQVLGHVKTVLIVVGGVLWFRYPVSAYNVLGICAVVSGSVLFSQIKS
eukprot:PhF_6_TR35081/c0_g1_i1/m.51129/K15285/SLC35E3; solute carrier family 35, member E3